MDIDAALIVILLGATPFFEARYAIPLALAYGFPPSPHLRSASSEIFFR
jgi:hypothetical protein